MEPKRIDEWDCVFCGYTMDAIDSVTDDDPQDANDGDIAVCLRCAEVYTLHGTKFEPITDDELIELPLEVKEKLSLIQLAIRNIDRVVEHAKEMLLENGRRHMGYTLYRGPTDAPDHYVIRGWDVSNGKTIHSNEAVTSPINPATLRTIREALKSLGLVCMGRMNADDPVILEVWM